MAQVLRPLHDLKLNDHPGVLIGLDQPDDAGVFQLASGEALVQTIDFFTPVVDDPYDWGRVAAANALSDVYAMGGEPITAMQIVAWPRQGLSLDLLGDVQRGGADILAEAGCVLIGGHSVDDSEPKYGLAVTGLVDPDRILTKGGARPGDQLVLTKPLGTGVISTAIKRDAASPLQITAATDTMVRLNRDAARLAVTHGVQSATDVTGFGLLGHLNEMATASSVKAIVDHRSVPFLPGVADLAAEGLVPAGSTRNLAAVEPVTDFGTVEPVFRVLLADAQTSGGLLMAVPPARVAELIEALGEAGSLAAAVVGEISAGEGITVR